MDAQERFDQLVRSEGSDLALDQATLLIAEAIDPSLPVADGLATLDRLSDAAAADNGVDVIRYLSDEVGLIGNAADYYDPLNSLLPRVIERRMGIPISLSIIAIEIGRRSGLRLVGIGMPGHFLVGDFDNPQQFYDLFNGGDVLDYDGCQRAFESVGGPTAEFHLGLLAPVDNLGITVRVLNNLKAIYTNLTDVDRLRIVTDLRRSLPSIRRTDRAALAVALASRGRFDEAAREFDGIARYTKGEDREGYKRRADQLWARLN